MSETSKAHRPRILSDEDRKEKRKKVDSNTIKIYFEEGMKKKVDAFLSQKLGSRNENLIKFFNSHPEFKKFLYKDT